MRTYSVVLGAVELRVYWFLTYFLFSSGGAACAAHPTPARHAPGSDLSEGINHTVYCRLPEGGCCRALCVNQDLGIDGARRDGSNRPASYINIEP
jgi:hypothetical protein